MLPDASCDVGPLSNTKIRPSGDHGHRMRCDISELDGLEHWYKLSKNVRHTVQQHRCELKAPGDEYRRKASSRKRGTVSDGVVWPCSCGMVVATHGALFPMLFEQVHAATWSLFRFPCWFPCGGDLPDRARCLNTGARVPPPVPVHPASHLQEAPMTAPSNMANTAANRHRTSLNPNRKSAASAVRVIVNTVVVLRSGMPT
jgi:hypothetical protein